jgi:hypothetical protein
MGYELEVRPASNDSAIDPDVGVSELERRWLLANERLADALARYTSLRGQLTAGDPAWIAAQLQLAWARQRCHEAGDEYGVNGFQNTLRQFHVRRSDAHP